MRKGERRGQRGKWSDENEVFKPVYNGNRQRRLQSVTRELLFVTNGASENVACQNYLRIRYYIIYFLKDEIILNYSIVCMQCTF